MLGSIPLKAIVISDGAKGPLRQFLRSRQPHPPATEMRITMAHNGSQDTTPKMAQRELPDIRPIRRPDIGLSATKFLSRATGLLRGPT